MQKKSLYFDIQKDEENEDILRCLSARPKQKNWPMYIDEKDLRTIYYFDREMGKFICARFCYIHFHGKDCIDVKAIFIGDVNVLCKIVKRAGANFKGIKMDGKNEENNVAINMLNELSSELPNLEWLWMLNCPSPS